MTLATTRIIKGHVIDALRTLPDESVHQVICSPPYWALRDYGTPPQAWGDGWEGELGQEPTPEMFVGHLVEVFREVKRVLRPDGNLWVNLGDGYAGSWGNQGRKEGRGTQRPVNGPMIQNVRDGRYPDKGSRTGAIPPGSRLKPKDLIGSPELFMFAMRDDGWWLRTRIPWIKYNGMMHSVVDRPCTSHEWFFGFARSARYYWDAIATRTPQKTLGARHEGKSGYREGHPSKGGIKHRELNPFGAARRTGDWTAESIDVAVAAAREQAMALLEWADHAEDIRKDQGLLSDPDGEPLAVIANVVPLKDEHFAAYPPRLIDPFIRAGTSEKGSCPACGAPWARVVEKERMPTRPGLVSKVYEKSPLNPKSPHSSHNGDICGNRDPARHCTVFHTRGWEPSCSCDAGDPVPCTVLDPFGGSGTTAEVAVKHGRSAILIELGDAYVDIQRRRLAGVEMPLLGATTTVERIA